MKAQNIFSRILDGLILLAFILFLSSAGFQDSRTSGWYQQFFPNLNGSTIQDMTFLDSLTGFAVTNPGTSIYCYILKTTNGGDNWVINYTYNSGSSIRFTAIQFANDSVGYASTNFYDFFKTTDKGLNWLLLTTPLGAEDMSVINNDTIFVVRSSGLGGGVYRSIDGGVSWNRIWTNGSSGNPSKIYMYDKNLGFICYNPQDPQFRKTTNGGFNWEFVNVDSFLDIKFVDTLTGWKGRTGIKKTTDGGLNWVLQTPPNLISFSVHSISIINKDTVWLGGTGVKIIENTFFGALSKTTNGGLNWGYQIPNMAIDSGIYTKVNFVNSHYGWGYYLDNSNGMHTTVGGNDSTVYTNIIKNEIVGSDYQLFQNYPNPFNNSSKFKIQNSKLSNIKILMYDIQGKEINTFVNQKLNPGTYDFTINANTLSSGIYFYSMIVDEKVIDTKRIVYLK